MYSSLIYPGGRWIHQSGKGLTDFGYKQINSKELKQLIFYPDATKLFKEAGIADGISIVTKDFLKTTLGFCYQYEGDERCSLHVAPPHDKLIPLNPVDIDISERITQTVIKREISFLHKHILPRSLFSIESDFVERNPSLVRPYQEGETLQEGEIKLLTNDKAGKAGRARWYVVNQSVITTGCEHLNRWKVIVSSANAGGQKRDNQIAVLDNRSAFGRSRVALKTFATEEEARNFFTYCQTDFIRYAFLLTDEALTSLGKLVPDLLDYSNNNGVIDYSGDVNEQLYTLFGIGDKLRSIISNTLR